MEEKDLCHRITELRLKKGVSARDMSLSVGQCANYITSIESGKSYPSWNAFLFICEYFNISPKDFFDLDTKDPARCRELLEAVKSLSDNQLDLLIALAKNMHH